jgi:hypothetical protein
MNSDLKKLFLLQMVFLCITGYSTVLIIIIFGKTVLHSDHLLPLMA